MCVNWLVSLECLRDCISSHGTGVYSLLGLIMKCMCDLEFITPEFCNKNNTTLTCAEITHDLGYSHMSNLLFGEIYTLHTYTIETGRTKMWLLVDSCYFSLIMPQRT